MSGHVHSCPERYEHVPCDSPGCDYTEPDLTLDNGTLCGPAVVCDKCEASRAPAGDPLPPDLVETVLRLESAIVTGEWTKGPAPTSDDVDGYSLSEDMDCTVRDAKGELVAVFLLDNEAEFSIACCRAAPALARAIQAATGDEAAGFLHHAVYSFLRRPKGPDEEKVSPEEATACAEYVARIWGEHVAACVKERP